MTRFGVRIAGALLAFAFSTVAAGDSSSATLVVTGMTCASCPVTVKNVLLKAPGVTEATVNYKAREAEVRFDPAQVRAEHLTKTVTAIGFPTTVKK